MSCIDRSSLVRVARLARLAASAALIVSSSCSKDKSPAYTTTNSVSATVDPAGGTVGDDTRASVEVPAGAVSQPVQIRISDVTAIQAGSALELPSSDQAQSNVLALEPHGQQFAQPVTIAVHYTADSTTDLDLVTTDGAGGWTPVAGAAFAGGAATAQVSHFSFFCVIKRRPIAADASTSPDTAAGQGGASGADASPGSDAAQCPASMPATLDTVCPSPGLSCFYGSMKCDCAANAPWLCTTIAL
jgi:hypothetical protein